MSEEATTAATGEAEAKALTETPAKTPEQERDEYKDLYRRALADMENMRKRNAKDRQDILRYAADRPMQELLPVFDNLQRAVEHASADPKTVVDGVKMILTLANMAFERLNVNAFGAVGENFDPNLHEAVQQVASDTLDKGCIAQVFERGYKLHDKLIRPAKVVVSTGPASAQAEPQAAAPAADGGFDPETGSGDDDLSRAAADLEDWEPGQ